MPTYDYRNDCKINYRCPLKWKRLLETDDPNKRFCAVCETDVVRIESLTGILEADGVRCFSLSEEGAGEQDNPRIMGAIGIDDYVTVSIYVGPMSQVSESQARELKGLTNSTWDVDKLRSFYGDGKAHLWDTMNVRRAPEILRALRQLGIAYSVKRT